jgi:hypothetical protein
MCNSYNTIWHYTDGRLVRQIFLHICQKGFTKCSKKVRGYYCNKGSKDSDINFVSNYTYVSKVTQFGVKFCSFHQIFIKFLNA